MLKGVPASSGIAIGRAYVLNRDEHIIKDFKVQDVEAEKSRFIAALSEAKKQLEEVKLEAEKNVGAKNSAIFDAHIMMLEDEELIASVYEKITKDKYNAGYAVKVTIDEYVEIFEAMENEYMRERGADVKDIGDRILNVLLNIENVSLKALSGENIVVAKDLTPSDTANMDKTKVIGFITQIGGKTSHSAIMARTLEIPAIVGVGEAADVIKSGDNLLMDGDEGVIYINPDREIIDNYIARKVEKQREKDSLLKLRDEASITLDGRKVELAANIGKPEDVHGVLVNGAEGIGLFRTEFLYMNKSDFPDEEEQFQAYKNVLEGMKDKPVVIRTLDIGGDKKLSYFSIPEEMNPFLGYRAIRLCLDRRDIFKTQLRALLRASSYGNLRIMFPMISCIEELRLAKSILEEVKSELDNEGVLYGRFQIGIMIEIPSAAIASDILAKEVDFFSIGTNDLLQYTFAVDRMNEKVSYLYNPYNPAFFRLINMVIKNAHENDIWVGMCGEVAGDIDIIPVLLGLGLDEFSMAAPLILRARKLIKELNYRECTSIADEVLKLSEADAIRELLDNNKSKNKDL